MKRIDDKTKNKILGYVRRYEHQEKVKSANIPIMIQYLIMVYYWVNEKFVIYGEGLEMDQENKNIIRVRPNSNINSFPWVNSAYGNNVIDINDTSIIRYKWSIRFVNKNGFSSLIGILKSNKNIGINACNMAVWQSHDTYYCMYINGNPVVLDGMRQLKRDQHPEMGKSGVMHLVLDIPTKTLKYTLNNDATEYIIADKIDLMNNEFRLGVSMGIRVKTNEMELLKFDTFQK